MRFLLLITTVLLVPEASHAATLTVGSDGEYATIAAAVAASADGDTLLVEAGTYQNDFAEISTKITLTAVGGRVVMRATVPVLQNKGILITDTDISITGFTFAGAHISDANGGNGAGIRYQGGNLSLTNCYFHNNQDGLLGDADPAGTITITTSEFAFNGDTRGKWAGYTHNIYIGAIAEADIESSYFHDVNVGHEIKSRAAVTIVNNTRVVDGPTSTAAYSIDLPNGGLASITNDEIEQGPDSQNYTIIAYGEEGNIIPGSALNISNTLVENDLIAGAPLGVWNQSGITAVLDTLDIYGLTPEQLVSGDATQSNITYPTTEPIIGTSHPFSGN